MSEEFENKSDDSLEDFDDIENEFSNTHKGYSQREKVSLILSHSIDFGEKQFLFIVLFL